MKTEIEKLLRARFIQFFSRLSFRTCIIQEGLDFHWLTNNVLRWQTNSQEAVLANGILRRAFDAGASSPIRVFPSRDL